MRLQRGGKVAQAHMDTDGGQGRIEPLAHGEQIAGGEAAAVERAGHKSPGGFDVPHAAPHAAGGEHKRPALHELVCIRKAAQRRHHITAPVR